MISPPIAANSGTAVTRMKIGSMAIALVAEYGDVPPRAISLSGRSCSTRRPAPASHAVIAATSPISPMPQLAGRRTREQRDEDAGTAAGRSAHAWLAARLEGRNMRETPSRKRVSEPIRLTTRCDSSARSRRSSGCQHVASARRLSTSSSSEQSEGTRTMAYHPPSASRTSQVGIAVPVAAR